MHAVFQNLYHIHLIPTIQINQALNMLNSGVNI